MSLMNKLKGSAKLIALSAGVSSCLSGCVQPPKNGQCYTREEIQDQENRAGFLRASGLLLKLGGLSAPDPLIGARAAIIGEASTLAASGQETLAAGNKISTSIYTNNSRGNDSRVNSTGGNNSRVNGTGGNNLSNRHGFSTAYSYLVDEDGDNKIDPSELKGAGNTFSLSREKQISFSTLVLGRKWDFLHFYLYDSNNNPVFYKGGMIVPSDDAFLGNFTIPASYFNKFKTRGKHTINWRIGMGPECTGKEEIIDVYNVNILD